MPYVETKHRPEPVHLYSAALAFTVLAALSVMTVRMSVGEVDIANAYEPALAEAKAIDSDMGVSQAEENIALHRSRAFNWSLATVGLWGTGILTAWLLTRTRTSGRYVY